MELLSSRIREDGGPDPRNHTHTHTHEERDRATETETQSNRDRDTEQQSDRAIERGRKREKRQFISLLHFSLFLALCGLGFFPH